MEMRYNKAKCLGIARGRGSESHHLNMTKTNTLCTMEHS